MVIRTTEQRTVDGPHGPEEYTATKEARIPVYINFDWLVDRVEVAHDDYARMPWDDGDGWEHDLLPFDAQMGFDNLRKARGYLRRAGTYQRVALNAQSYAGDTVENRIAYLRSRGASKQVARERVASDDRQYIDQLVTWYEDGYECVYIKLEVVIGGKTYEASCSGSEIEYAAAAAKEIAGEVACDLRHDGYIVLGTDSREEQYRESRRAGNIARLKRNPTMFDWQAK